MAKYIREHMDKDKLHKFKHDHYVTTFIEELLPLTKWDAEGGSDNMTLVLIDLKGTKVIEKNIAGDSESDSPIKPFVRKPSKREVNVFSRYMNLAPRAIVSKGAKKLDRPYRESDEDSDDPRYKIVENKIKSSKGVHVIQESSRQFQAAPVTENAEEARESDELDVRKVNQLG